MPANTKQHQPVCLCFIDASAQALTAYFRSGYSRSFRCCFLVFRFSSCLFSRRRMARVFLGRRSRGLYFLPWVMGEQGESEHQGLGATVAAKEAPEAGAELLGGTGRMPEATEGGHGGAQATL